MTALGYSNRIAPGVHAPLQDRFDFHYAEAAAYTRAYRAMDPSERDYDDLRYRANWHARMAVYMRQRMRIAAEPDTLTIEKAA